MVLQALLRPRLNSPADSPAERLGLLDCAAMALLLNLLHYLLHHASQPPAPALIHEVDALLKVSLQYSPSMPLHVFYLVKQTFYSSVVYIYGHV